MSPNPRYRDPGTGSLAREGFRPTTAPPIYSQDGQGYAATVHAHYFLGSSDWLVTEYDQEDDRAFGWACLGGDRQNAELGYVSITELAELRVPVNITAGGQLLQVGWQEVERETDWPTGLTITQAIDLLDRRHGR